MFESRCYDRDNDMVNNIVGDNNEIISDMAMNSNNVNMPAMENNNANMSCPLAEPMQERVVHRNIYHEVPQE